MSERSASTAPVTKVYLPSSSAAGFVRLYGTRDTRGCELTAAQQMNRFPASPYCAITWFVEGSVRLVSCGGISVDEPLSGCYVSGAQTAPFASRNCGEVHAFFAGFYPDAFHSLFGVDLQPLQNRFADAGAVLSGDGLALVQAVTVAGSDHERKELIERFVRERAGAIGSTVWTRMRRQGNRLSLAMASAVMGIGPRQLQRVLLRQTGLNFQTLLRLGRGERSFLAGLRGHLSGKRMDWAGHALDTDYADQSHMARDCKANTGRTPAQLARDVLTEEADWFYRLESHLDEDSTPSRPT
jgi:AraC-like DNA-binding protein